MNTSISGFGVLLGYALMVGVASFLEKFSNSTVHDRGSQCWVEF